MCLSAPTLTEHPILLFLISFAVIYYYIQMQLQNKILWSKYNDVSFHHLNSLHKREKSLPESQQVYAGFPSSLPLASKTWKILKIKLVSSNAYNGEGNGTPLQYSCLENPMDGGAWWAAVYGVAQSRTRLSDFTFTHWRRKWQPTLVFLPGESQGRGSLVGCLLWGRTESDTTEVT